MGIEDLYRFLGSDNDCIKVNKNLFNVFGFDEAVFYSYLVEKCYKSFKNQDYKYFADEAYFFAPVDEVEKALNLTPFKQRSIINKLHKKNLINVKFGQARARYISINSDIYSVQEVLFDKKKLMELESAFIRFMAQQVNNLSDNGENSVDSKYLLDYLMQKRNSIVHDLNCEVQNRELTKI